MMTSTEDPQRVTSWHACKDFHGPKQSIYKLLSHLCRSSSKVHLSLGSRDLRVQSV